MRMKRVIYNDLCGLGLQSLNLIDKTHLILYTYIDRVSSTFSKKKVKQ